PGAPVDGWRPATCPAGQRRSALSAPVGIRARSETSQSAIPDGGSAPPAGAGSGAGLAAAQRAVAAGESGDGGDAAVPLASGADTQPTNQFILPALFWPLSNRIHHGTYLPPRHFLSRSRRHRRPGQQFHQ